MKDFVHLHIHTEYSLLDGACRIDSLIDRAKELNMKALAITDHGNMYGAIPFYKTCLKAGIKPIIGSEIYITSGHRKEKLPRQEQKIHHLVLLAKNNIGYENIMKILTIGHLEGFHYKPRVDKETLLKYSEGIIALSACLAGEINSYLIDNNYDKAKEVALEYKDIFGENNFYIEMQDHNLKEQQRINPLLIKLSKELEIPIVATNDVHYINKEDSLIQDVLLAIGTGTSLDDEKRLKFPNDEFYLKTNKEMVEQFLKVPEAIENTIQIANRCNVSLNFKQNILPKYPLDINISADEYLRALAIRGINKRYNRQNKELFDRLEYELSIINKMGYADYFLIVWDFMKYAHKKEIMVGPGRGSAAGSIVAYALGITNVDPIKYGLLFERFLNPERVSMPDIDIDFNYERRDEVIQYVSNKYGYDRVAQIITFGTFAARAAIRDVGRVLNIPYAQVDKIAKLIPNQLGISIIQALEENKELDTLYNSNKDFNRLINIAMKIEGMPRHNSTHAAGVVISDKPLTNYTPLQNGQDNLSLTQYSMGILEELGILKMDFLGLRNLTIIEKTLYWIEKIENKKINIHSISFNDSLTYKLLSNGNTKGVFQLESSGVTKVLRELKPSNFEDIVAVLALYRPGPMEFIPEYIKAKHGEKKIVYPHESLKSILKDTYGIIVYQEQIMQIASTMSGFSLGESDLLRRAVGKKKREILVREREHFIKGALSEGYDSDSANKVYDMIVSFANYGFNRSHAVAYAVLAFQTAYLKANYPVEFMVALISESMGNPTKVVEYIEECRRMGIEVLPPDVVKSESSFSIEKGKIRFGLAAIKNLGTSVINSIISNRKKIGSYKSIMDFCMKVDSKVCNRKIMESLIFSGAFDSFEVHRAKIYANLDDLLERVSKKKKLINDLQINMFADFGGEINEEFAWIDVEPLTEGVKFQKEKEVLGLYLSGHPLEGYKSLLLKYQSHSFDELEKLSEGTLVTIGGIINDIKIILTKKMQQMAFVRLEIESNEIELVVFPKQFQKYQSELIIEQGILLKGKINHNEKKVKIIAERITLLSNLKNKESKTNKVIIKISSENEDTIKLNLLKEHLKENKGNVPVIIFYQRNNKSIKLKNEYWINPNHNLKTTIEKLLGKDTFIIR